MRELVEYEIHAISGSNMYCFGTMASNMLVSTLVGGVAGPE